MFVSGKEIVGYGSGSDSVEKIRFYLQREDERHEIALNEFCRTMHDYLFGKVTE